VILDTITTSNPVDRITAIGGGAKSEVWLQILSDIWQKPLIVPEYLEEATSMGAAICAGVSIGAFSGFDVVRQFNKPVKMIEPNAENADKYQKLYNLFNGVYTSLEGQFDIWGD